MQAEQKRNDLEQKLVDLKNKLKGRKFKKKYDQANTENQKLKARLADLGKELKRKSELCEKYKEDWLRVRLQVVKPSNRNSYPRDNIQIFTTTVFMHL